MWVMFCAALVCFSSLSQVASANESDTRVQMELESSARISAGVTKIRFQLVDTEQNVVITPSDLNVSHEKELHFIAYDPALREFQHLHPQFDGEAWTVDASFFVNGNYFIWAQGELSIDSVEFNSPTRIEVTGGQAAWPPPVLSDIRSGVDTGSVATLGNHPLKAGKMTMLMLTLTKTDGSPANITPYLGAFAHIIATGEDGSSLIHIHPMNSSRQNEGMVHVTFPAAGYYRLWVQFIDAGILKTVPLSVAVTN